MDYLALKCPYSKFRHVCPKITKKNDCGKKRKRKCCKTVKAWSCCPKMTDCPTYNISRSLQVDTLANIERNLHYDLLCEDEHSPKMPSNGTMLSSGSVSTLNFLK